MLVNVAKEKAIETAETTETAKAAGTSKFNEVGEYLKTNLAWVLCIWYPIIF